MSSHRSSSFRIGNKKDGSSKFYDQDDLDDAFDADQNINNPFSSTHVSSSSSKWSINESWRKFQQMIESNKDKAHLNTKNKQDIHSQELDNFSNDMDNELLDSSIYEGEEIQEGDTSYVPADDSYSELTDEKDLVKKDISVSMPINADNKDKSKFDDKENSNAHNDDTINTDRAGNDKDNHSKTSNLSGSNNQNNISSSISQANSFSSSLSNSLSKPQENKKDHHTFLFSKMKKNCSIERLNDELDDKDNEKELFETPKRNSIKDELVSLKSLVIKSNNNSSTSDNLTTSHTSNNHPSNIVKHPPQIKYNATLTKQSTTNQQPTSAKLTTTTSTTKSFPSSSADNFKSSPLSSNKKLTMSKMKVRMNLGEFEEEDSSKIDSFNSTDSSDKSLFRNQQKNNSQTNQSASHLNQSGLNVDDPIPSLPQFMSFIVDQFRKHFNFISFTTTFCAFFILFPAYRRVQSEESKSTSNAISQATQNTGVHEGWFFELVYSKKLGVDRLSPSEKSDYDKMPEAKLQLTYIKLEGTIMRVYVPKADQSKKFKPEMEKVNFLKVSNKMNQHIYDFSKMNTKKISLWLPKNIINKKKYIWSRKFPFILTIEETNKMAENKRNPFALILFCRTNRDKEEWYNKFKQSIEISDQNLQIHHLSTVASTPDEVTHDREQENIPRTKSLDIGNISYEFEHLSNFLNYETFIQDLLSHNLYSMSGGGASPSMNQNHQNSNQNDPQSPNTNTNLFWFNALVGRVFFDFLTHSHWTRWVKLKIQRKLNRIKLPYFIQTITLKDVNLGTSLPKFLSVANNPVIDEKGIWIDFDLDYQGCFSMTLETKLDLMKLKEAKAPERELKPMKSSMTPSSSNALLSDDDLSDPESVVSLSDEDSEENLSIENDPKSARFVKLLDKLVQHRYFQSATDTKFLKKKLEEVSNLPILLTVNVYKLKGTLTLNLPPAPTDRLWYGFRTIQEFQLESKPSFGERSVSLAPITQLLSRKLKQSFHKELCLPNLDDIILGNVMMGNENIEIVDEVP